MFNSGLSVSSGVRGGGSAASGSGVAPLFVPLYVFKYLNKHFQVQLLLLREGQVIQIVVFQTVVVSNRCWGSFEEGKGETDDVIW